MGITSAWCLQKKLNCPFNFLWIVTFHRKSNHNVLKSLGDYVTLTPASLAVTHLFRIMFFRINSALCISTSFSHQFCINSASFPHHFRINPTSFPHKFHIISASIPHHFRMVQMVTKKLMIKRLPEAKQRPASALPAGEPNSETRQRKCNSKNRYCWVQVPTRIRTHV